MMPSTISDYTQLTDAQLVAASLQGQKEAFGAIVTRYQGLVSGMLYNRCSGDISLSEELAQQTFVNAWQSLSTLRDTHKLSAWLCGIARNVHAKARRQANKLAAFESADELVSTAAEPSAAAITREQERLLWQSLERIPEKYREPMVLFYRQDQSVAEVAKALDEKADTIRKRLERGRAMLRAEVARSVEDTLRRSGPSIAFTLGVLAALPMFTSKASAATVGAGTAGSVVASGKLVALAPYLGPLMGIWGGIYGTMCSLRQAGSSRERQFIIRSAVGIFVGVGVLLACLMTLNYLRSSMTQGTYVSLTAAVWVVYAAALTTAIVYLNKRQAKIRADEGTDSADMSYLVAQSPWSKKSTVYGSMGGALFGSIAWILAMAYQVSDWRWLTAICVSSLLVYVGCTQTVIRRGPSAARGSLFCLASFIIGVYALTINLRLNPWLAGGAENALSIGPNGVEVNHVPLWAANLLLGAVSVAILVPIYFTIQPVGTTNESTAE